MRKLVFIVALLFYCIQAYSACPDCETLFFDDFESEYDTRFGGEWIFSGTKGQTPQLYTLPTFSQAIVFDVPSGAINNARNELTLPLNLEGFREVTLSFRVRARGMRVNDSPTTPFMGGYDGYGVAIGVDGETWHPISDYGPLSQQYADVTLCLDTAISTWSLSHANPVYIRFFHFGSLEFFHEGIAIDDVRVTGWREHRYNYGHAPDPPYATLRESDGARHLVSGPMLGNLASPEFDGAFGRISNDRDGALLPTSFLPGETASFQVSVSEACFLDGWFDFNGDGSWDCPEERVFTSMPLLAGTHTLTVAIPTDAAFTDRSYARFRVSAEGGLTPTGPADTGEVEDYAFTIVPPAPGVVPLPEFSAGHSNLVQWTAVAPGLRYQAEHGLTPDFSGDTSTTPWIDQSSHLFSGLEDGATHYYRVRSGVPMSGLPGLWRQNRMRPFCEGVRTNVQICDDSGVQLGRKRPQRQFMHDESVFENPLYFPFPMEDGGFANVLYAQTPCVLLEFSLYLKVAETAQVEFVVYQNSAGAPETFHQVVSVPLQVEPGERYYSSGALEVVIAQGRHYCIGIVVEDDVEIHVANTDTLDTFEFITIATLLNAWPAPDTFTTSLNPLPFPARFFARLTTVPDLDHFPSGVLVSPAISRPTHSTWSTLTYVGDTPPGAGLSVSILPVTGDVAIPGYAGLAAGTDISGLVNTTIRLRADLSTADATVTPTLRDWGVSWEAQDEYTLAGPWSSVVHSTQVNTPPEVTVIDLLDSTPTRLNEIRFEVTFSQPVSIAPESWNTSIYATHSHPEGAPSVVSIVGAAASYVVTVDGGGKSGVVSLNIDPGDAIVNLLGVPLADSHHGASAYLLDYDAPRVLTVERLHDQVPDTWPVAYRVVFSEPVYGVSGNDFSVAGETNAFIASIEGANDAYTVYLAPGDIEGIAHLEVSLGGTLVDHVGWPLAQSYTDAPEYWIDFEAPCVSQITLLDPAVTGDGQARFRVVFSEPVHTLSTVEPYGDFELHGTANASILSVSGENTTYEVVIDASEGDGTARLDVVTGGTLRDWAGRALCADHGEGPQYTFDFDPPRVHLIELLDPPVTNAPVLRFLVVFSKPVFNVELTPPFRDFALTGTAPGELLSIVGGNNEYTVTAAVGTEEGWLRLDVLNTGLLEDHLGRRLGAHYTSGPAYTVEWLRFLLMPEDITVRQGATVILEALAEGGTGAIEYTWYRSADGQHFLPMPGSGSERLTLFDVHPADSGCYYCVASDQYQSISSAVARLSVEEAVLGVSRKQATVALFFCLCALFGLARRRVRWASGLSESHRRT